MIDFLDIIYAAFVAVVVACALAGFLG